MEAVAGGISKRELLLTLHIKMLRRILRTQLVSSTIEALAKVMLTLLKDDTQVYKQFVENESFRRFVTDMVYTLTSEQP